MPPRPTTLMVLENHYERRVYYSTDGAAKGLGFAHKNNRNSPDSDLLIYRLDEEATAAANRDLHHLIPNSAKPMSTPYMTTKGMDWKAHKAAALAVLKRIWR